MEHSRQIIESVRKYLSHFLIAPLNPLKKSQINIPITIFVLIFSLSFAANSSVKSSNGKINFDLQSDGQPEMILNQSGLGIGVTPSSNLQVSGNTLISNSLNIATTNGASNLNIGGSMSISFQTVTSDTTIGDHSMVLVDSSSGNLTLTLPAAANVIGRRYTIKKITSDNEVKVLRTGSDLIDTTKDLDFSSGNLGVASLYSSASGQWNVLSHHQVEVNWTPSKISTELWLDPSNASTVTYNGSNRISAINDLSGNDNHAIQLSSSYYPTYLFSEFGGLNAIQFIGNDNDQHFDMTSSTNMVNKAFYIVLIMDDVTTDDSIIFGYTGQNMGIGIKNTGSAYFQSCAWSGISTNSLVTGTTYVIGFGQNTSSAPWFSINGDKEVTGGYSGGEEVFNLLGCRTTDGPSLQDDLYAKVGEIIITSSVPNDVTREKLEGYLAYKWGFSDNLISGHTYKGAAP